MRLEPTPTLFCSDEFELKFPELSQAELGRLQAEPSLGISIFELKQADFM